MPRTGFKIVEIHLVSAIVQVMKGISRPLEATPNLFGGVPMKDNMSARAEKHLKGSKKDSYRRPIVPGGVTNWGRPQNCRPIKMRGQRR